MQKIKSAASETIFMATMYIPVTVFIYIWVAACKNVSSSVCGQRRPRSACASVDIFYIIIELYRKYQWRARAQLRPCACAGWYESALGACWKTLFHLARPTYHLPSTSEYKKHIGVNMKFLLVSYNETRLVETSWHGPENLTLRFNFACVFIALKSNSF